MQVTIFQYFNDLKIKFLFLTIVFGGFNSNQLIAQCGSCTNPTGMVFINSGSVCYDENTVITSLTMIAGTLTICDGVTLTIAGASSFSGTALIQLGNCSEVIFKGSFGGSVNNGIVYIGNGSCDARVIIEGASTLGDSLTPDSEIHFCNLNGASVSGSPGSATIGCGLPLPIELLNFSAQIVSDEVVIEWVTASEINNDYFIVERSIDMINWQIVKSIDGAGNSSTIKEYKVVDESPLEGVSYYRLKQIDYDYKSSYSKVAIVNFTIDAVEIYVSKKAINSNIPLNDIEIYNAFGQQIPVFKITSKSFSTKGLAKGVYLVKTHNDIVEYHKIFIQ